MSINKVNLLYIIYIIIFIINIFYNLFNRNLPHQDTLETEKLKSLLNSISPSYKSFFRKESIVFIEFDDKISSLKCFKELSLQLPLFLIKEKILNENDEKLSIKLCRIDQKQKEFDLNT